MMASTSLTLALLHLFIWFNQRRQWAHLCLSITAVAVAVITGMEFMGMRFAGTRAAAEPYHGAEPVLPGNHSLKHVAIFGGENH
jgi:hypothetical protein